MTTLQWRILSKSLLHKFIPQPNYLFKNCSEFYSIARSAMMGCSETRKACWCRAELAGPAWLAWLRVIGQRAVNPVTAEAETQPPLRTLPPVLLAQATADSHPHIHTRAECTTVRLVVFSASDFAVISLHNSQSV